jgi:anti-sigma regulatory factor (Ser/Thr protein kinase)
MDRAVGHARRWLRDVLGREHPCMDDAALCMSELLTNALRYTESGRDGQIRVEVTYSARTVRIEVIDDGRTATVPRVTEAAELDVSGRGLRIVASIAKDWGTEPRGKGRAVWFEL